MRSTHKIILFGVFFLISSLFSCVYYQRYPMPKSRLAKVKQENLAFYLIDAGHPLTRAWYVSEINFQQDAMSGFANRLSPSETLEVSTLRNGRDARQSKNEVLIYIKPKTAMTMGDTLTTRLSFEQIERVEVHEPNFGKSVGLTLSWIAGAVFIGGAFLADY